MRGLCMVVLTAGFLGCASQQADDPGKRPGPFAADVQEPWQNAGAEVGWLIPNDRGSLLLRPEKEGKEGELPGFQFVKVWKDGVLTKLPTPQHDFGLSFRLAQVTDAKVKELARFTT